MIERVERWLAICEEDCESCVGNPALKSSSTRAFNRSELQVLERSSTGTLERSTVRALEQALEHSPNV